VPDLYNCDFYREESNGYEAGDHEPAVHHFVICDDLSDVVHQIADMQFREGAAGYNHYDNPLTYCITLNGRLLIEHHGPHYENTYAEDEDPAEQARLRDLADDILAQADEKILWFKARDDEAKKAKAIQSILDREEAEKAQLVRLLAKHGVPDSAP
jgi:hypothetical protein